MSDDTHLNRATHPVSLASGRPLAPGDTGAPDLDDPHDKALVDDGTLIAIETGDETPSKPRQRRTKKES